MTIGINSITQRMGYWTFSRNFLWYICFSVAYISSFFLSGSSLPSTNLDQSYQAVLEYARTHNLQFGKDIIFTFGPLGFLNTEVSQGFLPVQRILFALIWSGFVAWSATGLARQISGPMKFVFLVWFLIYSNIGGLGQHAFLVMAYGCMILMEDLKERKSASASFLIVFALLALVKFTFFMAATVGVILCALVHIGKRNIKSSFVIVASYMMVIFGIWLASGQQLENFWPWLKGSFEIVNGYPDAMTIFPKISVLAICAVAGTMFIASLWVIKRSARLTYSSVGLLFVITAYVFLSWKGGFVRADGHVIGYIFFLPLVFSFLLNETFQKTMLTRSRHYLATIFMGVVLLCNWAADFQEPGIMLSSLVGWPRSMIGNSRLVMNSVTGGWKNCFEALRESPKMRRVPELPNTRALVGNAPVDVFNFAQWAALANNLNYRPRPIVQGYAAYTPYLQDLNLAFYRSERRPQYLLYKMETIDGRFPALDDATILPYIFGNYKPVAKEGEYLVLQASRDISRDAGLSLVHEQTIAFGAPLDMSAYNNSLLILQVEVKSTLLGRLVKFLFQSPVLALNVKMNGETSSYRFIPAMAERGFVVSPLLFTNDDVKNYFEGTTTKRAESIDFARSKYAWGQLYNTITVRLYKCRVFTDGGA